MNTNIRRFLSIFLGLVFLFSLSLGRTFAQDVAVGIQQQMSPGEFKGAGLEKLTPAELAKLNAWLQGYREQAVAKAEKKATERAQRDKQSLIVSRINGAWGGIATGAIIELEDGSRWKLANDEHYGGSADHPAVAVWKAGIFGWKMRVSRIAEFYVNPVK